MVREPVLALFLWMDATPRFTASPKTAVAVELLVGFVIETQDTLSTPRT